MDEPQRDSGTTDPGAGPTDAAPVDATAPVDAGASAAGDGTTADARAADGTTADAGVAGPTAAAAAGTSRRAAAKPVPEKKKHKSFLRELPVLLVIAFVLALLIKTFLVQAFFIPSGSMEQTLLVGDRVLVNKLVYDFRDIHRGEVIVFNGEDSWTPEVTIPEPKNALERVRRSISGWLGFGAASERDYIKRVIGLPGDIVACCDDQGRVTVNGVGLDEPYLFENDSTKFGPVTVPEDRLFVLGDHRSRSSDSRYHITDEHKGTIPIDKVVGRAFVVIWPFDRFKGLKVPGSLEKTAEQQSLPAAPWTFTMAPPFLGLLGAVPLTALRRRLRNRRAR